MPWNNTIRVVVNYATSGAEIATLEVDPSQSAQDIQQEIFRLTGAPAYRQRLLHESEVLDPRRRLQDLGFTRELSLMLIVQDVLWLATTSVDGGVKIWNADTGEVVQTLGGHQNGVRHATFSSEVYVAYCRSGLYCKDMECVDWRAYRSSSWSHQCRVQSSLF